jgi:peptidoglycan/LPS O-acetylase OafA/YrhL
LGEIPTLSRDNGFTALRLLCAFFVLFTHAYIVVGRGAQEPLLHFTRTVPFSSLGVDSFFAISGFLVCGSILRDANPLNFLRSRALRIFPALIVVVALTVFVIGPIFTIDPAYWHQPATWKYLWSASVYGYHEMIPGLFTTNHVTLANGSLWTLPLEFTCYLLLLGLSWSRALSARSIVFVMAIMLTLDLGGGFQPRDYIFQMELWRLNRFAMLFFGGALLATLGDRVPYHRGAALAMAVGVGSLLVFEDDWHYAYPPYFLLLPYILVTAARSLKSLAWLNKWDASYGVYIYGALVQQIIFVLLPNLGPRTMVWVSAPIILLCGLISWRLIEKPALSLKTHREA